MHQDTELITQDHTLQMVRTKIGKLAAKGLSTVMHGEIGTGRTVLAHSFHRQTAYSTGPFVTVHCAAIMPERGAIEFVGNTKGVLQGASAYSGYFKQAARGTLFLHDIHELPDLAQSCLEVALDTGAYKEIGSNSEQQTTFNFVASTHVDLGSLAQQGTFRKKLYHSMPSPIHVPALRERPDDIPLLADHFTREFSNGENHGLTDKALEILTSHNWPGNVNELIAVIRAAIAHCIKDKKLLDETDILAFSPALNPR